MQIKRCIKLYIIRKKLLIESVTKHIWPFLITAFIGKAMSDIGSCNARPQRYSVNSYLKCNTGCVLDQNTCEEGCVLTRLKLKMHKEIRASKIWRHINTFGRLFTWQHTFSNLENSSMLCSHFQGSKWCGTLLGLSIENSLWLYIPSKALDTSCCGYLVGC